MVERRNSGGVAGVLLLLSSCCLLVLQLERKGTSFDFYSKRVIESKKKSKDEGIT
jgi:hypothetical protein